MGRQRALKGYAATELTGMILLDFWTLHMLWNQHEVSVVILLVLRLGVVF